MIMTQDKARKTAARQRMAETGEPYSVARHAVENEAAAENAAGIGVPEAAGERRSYAEQAQDLAERARRRADEAQDRADRAQERAERAEAGASQQAAAADTG